MLHVVEFDRFIKYSKLKMTKWQRVKCLTHYSLSKIYIICNSQFLINVSNTFKTDKPYNLYYFFYIHSPTKCSTIHIRSFLYFCPCRLTAVKLRIKNVI